MLSAQVPGAVAAVGRAPAQRHTSALYPAPLFVDKPQPNSIFGGISGDGSHAWVVSDSELFVYDLFASEEGPQRKAELAADLQEDEERVEKFLCVKEIIIRGESYLAASTRELNGGDSALLLFDMRCCKICTTIKLPYSASAIFQLGSLADRGGESLERGQDGPLTHFDSALLLGTTGGHLLVIDLAFVHRRQEVREMELHIVERNYDPTQFLAEHPNHIPCVALNREHHQGGRYCYHQENADMILLPEKAVHITTLAYAPEFDVVAIGFSFGTFQLWSLMSHRLLHSSPIGEGGLATKVPVSHLLFHSDESSYDLSGHSYLWVGRGSISSPLHSPSSSADVQLFSLKFKNACLNQINSTYSKKLCEYAQHACKIVDILLLVPREHHGKDKKDENQVGGTDWDLESSNETIFMEKNPWILFVWEVLSIDSASRLSIGLFNLDLDSVSSGFISLAYPFQKEKACLGVWVDPMSISDFLESSKGLLLEERKVLSHYAQAVPNLPISFDLSFLHIDTLTSCSWLGDQEKALSVFAQPLLPWTDPTLGLQTTYQECKNAGLLLNLGENSDGERDYRFQYRALFDMCLRLHLSSSICHRTNLNSLWDDGAYLFANPRVVLDWAWERYTSFEEALYDHGGQFYLATLSSNRRESSIFADSLSIILGRIWGLRNVFEALLSRHDNTDKGQKNLEEKYQHLSHTLQHLRVMLWMREKINNWLFLGDAKRIADEFQERRARRQAIYAESQRSLAFQTGMEIEDPSDTSLFIEMLLTSFPGTELYYPPRNLFEFLRHLFRESSHPYPLKHCITFYYLQDLAGWDLIKSDLLEDYARHFHLATPYVQLIKGLWGLDCGNKHNILASWKHLTEVSGEAARILEDWNRKVLRLLHDLGMRSHALHFLRWQQPLAVTPTDAILHMQILLENDLLSQAFNYQRLHLTSSTLSMSSIRNTLLEHIFTFFLAAGRMNELFKFHLDKVEEDALVHFLTAKAKGPGLEQLIHFFLQRGRYVEAMRAYEELTSSTVPLLPTERSTFLDRLIQNYKIALPSVALQPPRSLPWPKSPVGESTSPQPKLSGGSVESSVLTERISIPASPFGAPPSLGVPQRGWQSRPTDERMDLERVSNGKTLISPSKKAIPQSPYAQTTPRAKGVFGGALSSPVVSPPRALSISSSATSQLSSPLLLSTVPRPEEEGPPGDPTPKRRLAKRTRRGATPGLMLTDTQNH